MSTPSARCACMTAIHSSRSSRTLRSADHSSTIGWLAYRDASTSGSSGFTAPVWWLGPAGGEHARRPARSARAESGLRRHLVAVLRQRARELVVVDGQNLHGE